VADTDYPNRTLITASIMLAAIVGVLDSTIVAVALPQIQGALSASPEQVTWVLTSYIVATAISTPLSGWLAGRFGIKRVILVAISGFTITSILCGATTSLPEMVIFRIFQGLFGAAFIPLSQAVLLNINPPERHAHALSIWAAGVMTAPIAGPLLGGYLTELYSWRWCFYINLPVGVLAFVGVATFMPREKAQAFRPFDFLGFGALALSVGALQMMLDRGPGRDWFSSPEIWVYLVTAGAAVWVFLVQSLTAEHAFFDPALVRDRNLMTACFFNFTVGVLLMSSVGILPNMLQGLMGYPPMLAGITNAPRGAGTLVAILVAGRVSGRVDPRLLLAIALCIFGFGMWIATRFDLSMDTGPVLFSSFLQGFGMGLFATPLNFIAYATIDSSLRAEASSLYNLLRNIGSSGGIAAVQAIALANSQAMHESLAGRVSSVDQGLRAALPSSFDPSTLIGALTLEAEISRQSMMAAYVNVFRLLLLLCVLCMPLLLFLRPGRRTAELTLPPGSEP
jgi:MFS transporter, DHA2 family, multidrug resistance protein